jgi:hypothetical protein
VLYEFFISIGHQSKKCRSKRKNDFFGHISDTCRTNFLLFLLHEYFLQFFLMPLLNIHVYIIGLVKQIIKLLTINVTVPARVTKLVIWQIDYSLWDNTHEFFGWNGMRVLSLSEILTVESLDLRQRFLLTEHFSLLGLLSPTGLTLI